MKSSDLNTILLVMASASLSSCGGTTASQSTYYKALTDYARQLNTYVSQNDPNSVFVPITGPLVPIGSIMLRGNIQNECVIGQSLVNIFPMAAQPGATTSTSFSLSGKLPATFTGALATAGITINAESATTLQMANPQEHLMLPDEVKTLISKPSCLSVIGNRQVSIVTGIVYAQETWSWSVSQVAKVSGSTGPNSAGPSFNISVNEASKAPTGIQEVVAAAHFFILTPAAVKVTTPPVGVAPSPSQPEAVLLYGGPVDKSALTTLSSGKM